MDKANFAAAIKDYDEAIRLQPGNWRAYSSRGEARRLLGDLIALWRITMRPSSAIGTQSTPTTTVPSSGATREELDRAMADYDGSDPAQPELRSGLCKSRRDLAIEGQS